jgi:hypothetical protein
MKIYTKGKITKKEAGEFYEGVGKARKTKLELSIDLTTEKERIEEKEGIAKKLLEFSIVLYSLGDRIKWYKGMGLVIIISIILSSLIGFYLVPCIQKTLPFFISEETGHYLLSSIFQGFASLFAMGAAAVVFRWEYLRSIGEADDWLKKTTTIAFANVGFTLLITLFALALFDVGEGVRHSMYVLVLVWVIPSLVHFGILLYKIFALGIRNNSKNKK